MVTGLEAVFPRLVGKQYKITSPEDDIYNCIAWAIGITNDWWWPDELGKGRWPTNVPRETSVDAFRSAFASFGFVPCSSADIEPGFEKIALFASIQGAPKHATRQLATGRWTSKLGKLHEIEHGLRDLEGVVYGSVVLIKSRPVARTV